VLDVGLPEMDGWQVLERLRDVSDVPVLVLTAHGQEAEKVRGLRGGADDYLTKPFANNELLARVEALLRRSSERAEQLGQPGLRRRPGAPRPDQAPGLRQGRREALTPTEFRLLNALVRHAGAVLSPNQLLTQAWDDPTGIGQERVKFAVLRLRRKLGWSDPDESPIESVRGFGYRYRRPGGTSLAAVHGCPQVRRRRSMRAVEAEQEVVRGRPWRDRRRIPHGEPREPGPDRPGPGGLEQEPDSRT
jgi:DNA-binding response OmpR family regulator